jgi:tetratricopeptide (TPR) repeat protein
VCIIASNVLDIVLLNLQANYLNSAIELGNYHSLGASGAIAGIMGLFVVRCFFARLMFSFPFLFLPFISVPLRIQATLLISIFFALDLSGSIGQFETDGSRIDYWAHVGGYLGGFFMGYIMGLHKEANTEALKVKAKRFSKAPHNNKNTSALYEEILDKEPENEEALIYFFNIHKFNPAKAEQYYARLVQLRIRSDFNKALELFKEHFPDFLKALPGDILLRFGLHFFKNADLQKARMCLEIASSKNGAWQPKAMMALAQTFEGLGNKRYAEQLYNDILKRFPDSAFQIEASSVLKSI